MRTRHTAFAIAIAALVALASVTGFMLASQHTPSAQATVAMVPAAPELVQSVTIPITDPSPPPAPTTAPPATPTTGHMTVTIIEPTTKTSVKVRTETKTRTKTTSVTPPPADTPFIKEARKHCDYTKANALWWFDGDTSTGPVSDNKPLFNQACPGKRYTKMAAAATDTPTTTTYPKGGWKPDLGPEYPQQCIKDAASDKIEADKPCSIKYGVTIYWSYFQCWFAYHMDEPIDPAFKQRVDDWCSQYGPSVRE